MAYDNTITVVGNLTRDPELRFTNSGQAVASFGLAWNRKWTNKQTNQEEEKVSFFDVTVWGKMAENTATSLAKGDRVVVYGRIEQDSWESPEGEKRSKIEIQAEEVAPSLRWATAQPIRNERDDNQSSGSSGGGSRAPRQAPTAPAYDPDEEPFRVDAGEWTPGFFGEYPERLLP